MADQWMRGDGTDALEGGDLASLIDDYTTSYLQNPLNRLLRNYRVGVGLTYTSASSVTIGVGELSLKNSGDTVMRMRRNTSTVVVDITADLDTGAEANSTTYYVYAVADADATTFTGIISASDTFPTGVTYAKKVGSFYNGSGGDIDPSSVYTTSEVPSTSMGSHVTTDRDGATLANGTAYLAYTDGLVVGIGAAGGIVTMNGYTDGNADPTGTTVARVVIDATATSGTDTITFPVRAGDYWEVDGCNSSIRWTSL